MEELTQEQLIAYYGSCGPWYTDDSCSFCQNVGCDCLKWGTAEDDLELVPPAGRGNRERMDLVRMRTGRHPSVDNVLMTHAGRKPRPDRHKTQRKGR